jgi:alkanesulfonate monooxygenase SsuD/methylene tetrahydromethanopterin reductase-like flavin-dependent oxidoreductase (luciferase family)
VRIGAQFMCQDFKECMASVGKAEEAGYGYAWFIDSQILWQDVYVYMTAGLERTERIVFGTGVTNPYTRHLTVTASAFATLAQLHPGRLILGVGRGDSAVRTMGLNPVPTRTLRESIPVLRDLLAGRTVEINGADVHLRWVQEDVGVPICLSATGPKNLRAAGGLADVVMLYVGVNPVSIRWAMDHVRAGAKEAGRDPDAIRFSVLTAMFVGDDQEEAWAKCRWAPASCANHIADTMKRNPAHGMPEPMTRLPQARDRARDRYDYYAGHLDSAADHTEYLTGDLVDDFAIAGTAEKCLAKVHELEALGIDEISCAYLNGEFEQMERVGREIIAPLAGAGSGR